MKTHLYLLPLLASACISPLSANNLAIENPQVASGQVSFEGLQSDQATITQLSNKAIVDYTRFDVLAGGSVNFNQPSAQAAILNRISSADPSMLNGAITGNGQIYFVNPAGITFGPNSVIRADTFMAVAGQIMNEDFLAGQLNFDLQGNVSNYGLIETLNGNVLLGNKVLNAGNIISKSGVSILTAGDEVLLRANGSSLAVQLMDKSDTVSAGIAIENTGEISGDDVLFSAGDAYSVALSNSGTVTAAKSAKLYADGGRIEVAGEVSARNEQSAGLIEIGGTDQGGPGAPIASEVLIAESAVIDASAISEGDGGHVVIYADKLTTMLGAVYAEAAGEGQGGFIEISAKELDLGTGLWDISLGSGGTLLFDPTDVDIDPTYATNIKNQLDANTDVLVHTVGAGGFGDITVNAEILADLSLSTGDLTLTADRDIIVNNVIDVGSGSLFLNAKNGITLNASLAAGVSGSGSQVALAAEGGAVTIASSANIELSGDAFAQITAQQFINNSSIGGISGTAGANFWQIALPDVYGATANTLPHTYGGLDSGNKAVYGSSGTATVTANEYHFQNVPVVSLTVSNDAKTYGEEPGSAGFQGYVVDDLTYVDAASFGDVFVQDDSSNTIIDTSVVFSSDGAPTTANVGVYDITAEGFASTNGYGFNVVDGSLTVNTRAITVTADDRTRIYGDSLDLGTSGFQVLDAPSASSTLPNGEVIEFVQLGSANSYATGTSTAVSAGYVDEVTVGALGGSEGFDANNYLITKVSGDLEITTRAITVTAAQQGKVYGNVSSLDPTAIVVTDLNGGNLLPNGEQISSGTMGYVSGPDLAASPISDAVTTPSIIELTAVSGDSGFDVANYFITYSTGDYVVTPRPIAVLGNDQSKQYGDVGVLDNTAFSVWDSLTSTGNIPNAEVISTVDVVSTGSYDTDTAQGVNAFTNDLVISNALGGSGYKASNYAITYVAGDYAVAPRVITLTANEQTRGYGDTITLDTTPTAFTLADKDGGGVLPNGNTIESVSITSVGSVATTTTSNAGTYVDNLELSGQVGDNGFNVSNYDITYVDGNFVITTRALEVIASQQEKYYGDALVLDNTAFTFVDSDITPAALPNGEKIDFVSVSSTGGHDASTTSGTNTYSNDLVLSDQSGSNGFDADNYLITYTAGDLVVNARPIIVSAAAQEKIFGDAAMLDDTAFTVADLDGGALPNAESIDTVTLLSGGGTDLASNAATYTDDLSITDQAGSAGFDADNYAITYADGDFVVTPRAITLTANEQTRGYGDTITLDTTPTAFTLVDKDDDGVLPNGNTIESVSVTSVGSVATTTTSNAGTYVDNLELSGQVGDNGFNVSNYDITYVDGNFVITTRAVEVIASQQEKYYGDALVLDNTAFTFVDSDITPAALPNGEKIDFVSVSSTGGHDASTTSGTNTYSNDLVLSDQSGSNGFDADNYVITYTAGDLVVNARPITVSATAQGQVYGENVALDDTAFTVTDLDGGALPNAEIIDTVTLLSSGGVSPTSNAVTYTDDLSITDQSGSAGFDADNYAITYETADYTVTPRAITLTATDQTKPFGSSLTPDNTAFTLFDLLSETDMLPNGESVDTVSIESVDQLAQDEGALPGDYGGNLVLDGQDGGNGFAPSNYSITYIEGDLTVEYMPDPPITMVQAQPDFWRDIYAGNPMNPLFTESSAISTNPITEVVESPIWKRLSRFQQSWVLEQIGLLEDEKKITQELLNYLLAESSAK